MDKVGRAKAEDRMIGGADAGFAKPGAEHWLASVGRCRLKPG